jgi:hypothetical protein
MEKRKKKRIYLCVGSGRIESRRKNLARVNGTKRGRRRRGRKNKTKKSNWVNPTVERDSRRKHSI